MPDTPLPVCLLVHANLQYAEIPVSETKNIVTKSYLPTLDMLLSRPKTRIIMDFSGYTLEILSQNYPQVIEKIRLLIQKGNIELCASTFSNPLLPLIPLPNAKRQIKKFQQIFHHLFGDLGYKPQGFFPQEYFIDAATISLLADLGHQWIPIYGLQYLNSIHHNLNLALQEPITHEKIDADLALQQQLAQPIKILGALGKTINGFSIHDTLLHNLHNLYENKISWQQYKTYLLSLQSDAKSCFCFLGPSDMEFIGHFNFQQHQAIDPNWLDKFCRQIEQDNALIFQSPIEFLTLNKISHNHYLKCGGDHVLLDPWIRDPDNVRLNKLCDDTTRLLNNLESQITTLQVLGFSLKTAEEKMSEAWHALMLAENADGRGWKPIPERRLFCYDYAVLAQEIAEEVKVLVANLQNKTIPLAMHKA